MNTLRRLFYKLLLLDFHSDLYWDGYEFVHQPPLKLVINKFLSLVQYNSDPRLLLVSVMLRDKNRCEIIGYKFCWVNLDGSSNS